MEITATRNWSHNSFENAMNHFAPLICADWMTYLKISPIEYSEWSDTIYVVLEFDVTEEAQRHIESMELGEREKLKQRISLYIKSYFRTFLNTNIGIKEFRRPAIYIDKKYLYLND